MAVIILFHFWLLFDVFACAETIYMMTKVKLIIFLCVLWQKSLNQSTEKKRFIAREHSECLPYLSFCLFVTRWYCVEVTD